MAEHSIPQRFTDSVFSFAVADKRWPELRIIDQAARELWNTFSHASARPRAQKSRVVRSAWFDQRCADFIGRYPQGHFIALEPGLNTRFHRLSQATDWPRFYWCDIDRSDIAEAKGHLLPAVDHYQQRAVQGNNYTEQVQAYRQQQSNSCTTAPPLLLIVEGADQVLTQAQWQELLAVLSTLAADAPVELLYDYRAVFNSPMLDSRHAFSALNASSTAGGQVLCRSRIRAGFWRALAGAYYGQHLRLNAGGSGH